MSYDYSYTKEIQPGQSPVSERVRYRGRCSCGRKTHMGYSTPAAALSAIRLTHNPNIEGEGHEPSS